MKNAAGSIAGQLGIREVHWECLPEDKLNWIEQYQKKKELPVCMIGDGINDAPALKEDVGIAMGGVGSDIAVDAADIALVDDQVAGDPTSDGAVQTDDAYHPSESDVFHDAELCGVILAITGILNPVAGATGAQRWLRTGFSSIRSFATVTSGRMKINDVGITKNAGGLHYAAPAFHIRSWGSFHGFLNSCNFCRACVG